MIPTKQLKSIRNTKYILGLAFLLSCSKDPVHYPNENLIVNTKWLVTAETKNGVADTLVSLKQTTINFRSDGRMYVNQVWPGIPDTVKFEFADNNNIRITKPWANYPVNIDYSIKRLDSSHFDFTITAREHADVYDLKAVKQ